MSNGSNIDQCLKSITFIGKYFLTFYDKELQTSGVTVISLLIRRNGKQEFVECEFCHRLSPSFKDFESDIGFENWWVPVENHEDWWNFANTGKQEKLLDDLASNFMLHGCAGKRSPNLNR